MRLEYWHFCENPNQKWETMGAYFEQRFIFSVRNWKFSQDEKSLFSRTIFPLDDLFCIRLYHRLFVWNFYIIIFLLLCKTGVVYNITHTYPFYGRFVLQNVTVEFPSFSFIYFFLRFPFKVHSMWLPKIIIRSCVCSL